MKHSVKNGFTLIELSIVLIIIGLIVGGILVGRDLITAAAVRAQLSQIEKYNSAVNTFRAKYGYLPGDIPEPYASQQGLAHRGQYAGEGDGNGLLECVLNDVADSNVGYCQAAGETVMFWSDLTYANGSNPNLIDGSFSTASTTSPNYTYLTGANLDLYLPKAKIGFGNYLYVFSGAWSPVASGSQYSSYGANYYGLSQAAGIDNTDLGEVLGPSTLPVYMAYAIDKKIDDGLPQSGNVVARYLGGIFWRWAYGNPMATSGACSPTGGPTTIATLPSTYTCYDNNGIVGPQNYSMGFNNGNNTSCALSFKFQ